MVETGRKPSLMQIQEEKDDALQALVVVTACAICQKLHLPPTDARLDALEAEVGVQMQLLRRLVKEGKI